tara:strand:- start:1901 stop:2899 length:999 start_codon:yes stop_codon:yes gene_type:complete
MGRRGWIFSGVLHVTIISAAVLGLPSLFDGDPEVVEESIVVSMIAEEDVAGIQRREPEPELMQEPELEPLVEEVSEPELEPAKTKTPKPLPPEPEPIEVQTPEPPPLPEPEYVAIEPVPKPEPEPESLPEPKPVVEKKLPELPLVKPEPKPEAAPDPPLKTLAPVPKPVVKPKPSFDSLLKSVAAEKEEAELPSEPELEPTFDKLLASVVDEPVQKAKELDRSRPARSMSPALSNQIAAVIKDRVEANWSVPAGARDAGNLVVNIRIRLGRDGVVQSAEILDVDYAADSNLRTMAESARRAVQKASPIKALRRFGDEYNEWRDVTMTFRPPV